MPDATITDYNDHIGSDGLPSEWPLLKAEHIFQGGGLHEPFNVNCSCLMGWVNNILGPGPKHSAVRNRIYDAMRDAIDELIADVPMERVSDSVLVKNYLTTEPRLIPIPLFSDGSDPAFIARVWNRTGAKLGYVVGNQEAN